MNLITIILIVAVAVFFVIGLIIGLVKGFSEIHPWSSELLLTAVVTCLVAYYTADSLSDSTYFAVVLSVCVACILIFIIVNRIIKAAMGDGKSGVDRFFGGVALAIKGAVLAAIIAALVLIILDIVFPGTGAEDGSMPSVYYEFINSGFWEKAGSILMDSLVLTMILSSFRSGFEHGLVSALWGFIVFILVIGCFVGAYFLAYQTGPFVSMGESLGGSLIGDTFGESMTAVLGKLIVAAIICVVLLIIVITLSTLISRAIRHARQGATVSIIDGLFGGLMLGAICIVVLMFVGAFLTQYYSGYYLVYFGAGEITFMDYFMERYVGEGTFSSIFFTKNILLQNESIANMFRNLSLIKYMID